MFVEIVRFVFTVLGALAGCQTTTDLQRDDRLAFLPHGSGFVAYGVGYLDGGAMIVVEDGRSMVAAFARAQVTSIPRNTGREIVAKTVRA